MKDTYKKQVSFLLEILPAIAKEDVFALGGTAINLFLFKYASFIGMTDNPFGNDDYEATREQFIKMIVESLSPEDKAFLFAFIKGEPDWTRLDFGKYPAVKWKLLNIRKLKENNLQKYTEQVNAIKQILFAS